jgi:bifunctional enzyme CysN/CysC
MKWYAGPTLTESLDGFASEPPPSGQRFRMPVQGVYKFTQQQDERRIVAGTVESGHVGVGDELVFYPSGKRSRIRSIEGFSQPSRARVGALEATGVTLEDHLYLTRGEIAARGGEPPPCVGTRVRANLFWLGRSSLTPSKRYTLKLGSARAAVRVTEVHRVIDAVALDVTDQRQQVDRHEVAECTLETARPIAFDLTSDVAATSRFVIVDEYEIAGGGIITEALPDSQTAVRDRVLRRNLKWSAGGVSQERRAERLSQRAMLVLITGERETDRKAFGRSLEGRLFDDGRFVYFLAIGNLVHGVDADLESTGSNRSEHVRRLSEVANIMLDAGLIVIATAIGLSGDELDVMRTAVGADRVIAVWIGQRQPAGAFDAVIDGDEEEDVARLKAMLQDKGVIYRSW